MWSLSLGATSSSFRVLPLLKWTSMPYFFPMFFIVSLRPSSYGTVMWPLFFVWMFLLFCLVFGCIYLQFHSSWLPSLGIYMLSGPSVCVYVLLPATSYWNRCFLPCVGVCLWCYICCLWHGGCPTADIGLYEWAFCTPWFPDFLSLLGVTRVFQKGHRPISFGGFSCELYFFFYWVYML